MDDQQEYLDYVSLVFTRAGYIVKTANDGNTALGIIERENIHLVITDIYMPEMSGVELAKKIRSKQKTLPIIVITADELTEAQIKKLTDEKSQQLIINDFVKKSDFQPDSVSLQFKMNALMHTYATELENIGLLSSLAQYTVILKESEEKYRKLLQSSPLATVLVDEGCFLLVNKAAPKLFGVRSVDDLIGKKIFDFIADRDIERLRGFYKARIAGEEMVDGMYLPNKYFAAGKKDDGEEFYAEIYASLVSFNGRPVAQYIIQDITARIRARKRLEYLAYYGRLNIRNVAYLLKRIQQLQKRGVPHALLIVELKKFKDINDMYGSLVGDEILKVVAKKLYDLLKGFFPEEDPSSLLARNHTEFILFLPGVSDNTDLLQIATDVVALLSSEIKIKGSTRHSRMSGLNMSTCIGGCLSVYSKDANSLMHHAQIALHEAEKNGPRNHQRVMMYDTAMGWRKRDQDEFKKILVNAIESIDKNGEFYLVYQPQTDFKGQILGVEALLRWRSSMLERIVPPFEFIELASREHLITLITKWVLKQVCAQIKRWKKGDFPIPVVSVNISRQDLDKRQFLDFIKKLLKKNKIDPHLIKLEITESGELTEENIDCLRALMQEGVRFAVDDFGTEQASFATVSDLQDAGLDTVKIDKYFMDKLIEKDSLGFTIREKKGHIVDAIIEMGRALELSIVAEGVEHIEQVNFLKEKDPNIIIQGYYGDNYPVIPEELDLKKIKPS